MELFKRLFSKEQGVSLIEYALIGLLIAVALVLTLDSIGQIVENYYQSIAGEFP